MAVVVATPPGDDFRVIEFSAGGPGALDRPLATVRPRIGVVTTIGTDHLKAFHSIEAIAEEKAKVIACLPEDGTAVLNADDPLVIAMADRFSGNRSEEHTSELQSLMRISYAVFCLKKKNKKTDTPYTYNHNMNH